MDFSIEDRRAASVRKLQELESFLEQEIRSQEISYSGLKDIDANLKLINTRFKIAIQLIERIEAGQLSSSIEALHDLAQEKSKEAVQMLEDLVGENISEDQKSLITEAKGYREAKENFQLLLLKGGGVFFERKIEDAKKARLIARIITKSIRKHTAPDDRYSQVFKTEELPKILRRLVNFFLPILAPENQKEPPYGIGEGEEVEYSSKKIKLPLSQAIFYLENELLPKFEKELKDYPDNHYLQQQLYSTRRRIEEYKQLKFIPRATPIVMEKGFYTNWLNGYTADGEMLVTVALPVRFKSGTNLDRIQELVQAEITRELAGKGISASLDKDYHYLKKLESGRRGDSRVPSSKINTAKGFRVLKNSYPFLKHLEEKKDFQKLVDLVQQRGKRPTQKLLEQMILTGDSKFKSLP